jgi:hypothetical protein
MTGNTPAAAGRRWERGLLAALAGLSALAWYATRRLAMPSMRAGILTGHHTSGMDGGGAPMALGLFLLTWAVMMAAMMLPAAAPVVLAVPERSVLSGSFRGELVIHRQRTLGDRDPVVGRFAAQSLIFLHRLMSPLVACGQRHRDGPVPAGQPGACGEALPRHSVV